MNKLEKECTDFIIKVRNTEDLQAAVNAEVAIRTKMYKKGYGDCSNDRRKISKALKHAAEKDFQEDLEVIDDVMSSPFDVEHQ
jgi:phage/plasmid-associated DNA primase